MSDQELRTLERDRLAVAGDVVAEARHLAARLRAGTLPPRRLEVAAYCAHPAAVAIVGSQATLQGPACTESVDAPGGGWERWVRGLEAWGWEPVARAALAAGELALKDWEGRTFLSSFCGCMVGVDGSYRPCPQHTAPREVVTALRPWIDCPCASHQAPLGKLRDDPRIQNSPLWAFQLAGVAGVGWAVSGAASIMNCTNYTGVDKVRPAVLSALVGWALA